MTVRLWLSGVGKRVGASVVCGQEYRRDGAVGFGDDPELRPVCAVIGGEKAEAFSQGELILSLVFGIEVSPVAAEMAG